MKRLTYGGLVLFGAIATVLTSGPVIAQSPGKKAASTVPITYPGDSSEMIARRAQWVEAAKKEGSLVWWGDLRPNEAKPIIAEFNKAYPFIKVEFSRQASDEQAAQLEAEFTVGKIKVDVMEGGGRPNFPRWRKIGLMVPFTDLIPGIHNIPKNNYSRFKDWAMIGNNAITPQYNTKLISTANAPKSWEDLLDPKWKGKLGMTADMKVWAVFALAENGWGMERTENFLRNLREQNLIWASGHTAGHSLVIAGDFPIMVEEYLYHVLQSQKKGAPISWIKVSHVPVTGQAFWRVGKGPHPNAGNLFIEWIFSPTGLKAYETVTQRGAIYPGAGTLQANLLEGVTLMPRTEEIEMKINDMDLHNRFAKILGVKPSL